MTSQNEEAEELMRKIEKEEEQLAYEDPDKKVFHLCIVNLVIGKGPPTHDAEFADEYSSTNNL